MHTVSVLSGGVSLKGREFPKYKNIFAQCTAYVSLGPCIC